MKHKTRQFILLSARKTATPALAEMLDTCMETLKDLERPMRVAVTGEIKTGKSTLTNALLGRKVAPTAVEVLTYNVTWMHHVKYSDDGKEKFIVHYKDESTEEHPLEDIAIYVTPDKGAAENIHYVEVFIDNPMLEKFDLMDTPGLRSLTGKDSQHTLDLLSKDENKPDAVIYLVKKKGFLKDDMQVMWEFHNDDGPTLTSGIRAVAAITRVDEMDGRHEAARVVADRNIHDYAETRFFFSKLFTIAALPAQAAFTMTAEDINSLRRLSNMKGYNQFLYDKEAFLKCDKLTPQEKDSLLEQLTVKGITLAVEHLSEHPEADDEDVRRHLRDFSNVGQLKEYVEKQFGERATFYKCEAAVQKIRWKCSRMLRKPALSLTDKETLKEVMRMTNTADYDLHEQFAAYYIINDFYEMKTYFKDEEWERARRILGDMGTRTAERLGIHENSTTEATTAALGNERSYWRRKAHNMLLKGNVKGAEAARTITEIIEKKQNTNSWE